MCNRDNARDIAACPDEFIYLFICNLFIVDKNIYIVKYQ